jgi:hypothetical protein
MKEGAQSAVAAASQSAVKEKELAAAFTFPVVSGKKQAALQPQRNPPTALQGLGLPGADAEILSGKLSGKSAAGE